MAEALHLSVTEVNELLTEDAIGLFSVMLSTIHDYQQETWQRHK